jgi:hypothetical protein
MQTASYRQGRKQELEQGQEEKDRQRELEPEPEPELGPEAEVFNSTKTCSCTTDLQD